MTRHVGQIETEVTPIDHEVVDEVAAHIQGRQQVAAEAVGSQRAFAGRQQLQLQNAPGGSVLFELVEVLPQQPVGLLQLALEAMVVADQAGLVQSRDDGVFQHRHVLYRLGDEIPGALAQRLDGVAHDAGAGHHHQRQVGLFGVQRLQHVEAVEVRQPQVAQHEIGRGVADHVDAAGAVFRFRDPESAVFEVAHHVEAHHRIVFDDQDAPGLDAGLRRLHHTGSHRPVTARASAVMSSTGFLNTGMSSSP